MFNLPLLKSPYSHLYDDAPFLDDIIPRKQPDMSASTTRPTIPVGNRTHRLLWDLAGLVAIYVLVFIFYMILASPILYFRLDDTSLMYPLVYTKVPSVLVALLSILLPLAVILLFHVFFAWNKWDLIAGFYGALLAYTLALLFTSILWYFVGGLRPYFLSNCQPDPTKLTSGVTYYTTDVCSNKGDFTRDTFHGFPSGHASTAFAGCVFLSAYLAAHLRMYRNGNTFKIFIVFLPIMCAFWLSSSRITDHHHSTIQVVTGALIGILSALFAYKMVFLQGFWFGSGKWAHVAYLHYGNI